MCRGLIKNSWRDITIWLCITFIILLLQDNATRAGLLLEIKDLFQRLCLCPESPTVDITAFQCSPSGIFLSVEGILTYSDEEGKITASTIIDLLMLHTISSRPPVLIVDGVQYTLRFSSNTCPYLVSSSNFHEVCMESLETCPRDLVKNSMGVLVLCGLFVGGFVAGVILTCATVIITRLAMHSSCSMMKLYVKGL